MKSIKRAFSKKRMLTLILLILLVCLSIGYAYLFQKLNITTTAIVAKNSWDIHFENIVVDERSVEGVPVIGDDKTSVSVSVNLQKPGEFFEYYVDIVNNGTIDAEIESVFISSLMGEQKNYLDYKVHYKAGGEIKKNDLLRAGEKDTIKIVIKFKPMTNPSNLPSNTETIELGCQLGYRQDNGGGVERPSPVIMQKDENHEFWSESLISKVQTITFGTELKPPTNIVKSLDISSKQDGKVMAYYAVNQSNPSFYDLYIQGDGSLYANSASRYLFKDFSNLTTINDGDKLDMSLTFSMTGMFWGCEKLTALDTSKWDLKNVKSANLVFVDCKALSFLDVSFWDLSRATDISQLFQGCTSLNHIDTSRWDVSKVTNMNATFAGCSSLTTIDVSGWDTSNVSMFSYTFLGDTKLNFDISKLRFTNATSVIHMFQNCSLLNGTLNMNGANIASYEGMLIIDEHAEGLQITLNYTTKSESLVNAILADSSTTAHVVKGSLIS